MTNREYFAQILGEVLSDAKMATYEYTESVLPQVETEYAQAIGTPEVFALDVAHQLAFRHGLGNSMFATPHTEVPYDMAINYAKQTFSSPSNIAVVASNVESSSLKSMVGEHFESSSNTSATSAPSSTPSASDRYYGGEVRVPATAHGGHDKGFLLVAFKGGPASSPEYSVLRHLLGGEAAVKWSQGSSGFAATAQGANAFSLGYSDAGLIGFNVSAQTEKVEGIAKEAVQEFKRVAKGGLKDEDVKRAVAKAKFEAASSFESRVSKLEFVGSQVSIASGLHLQHVLSALQLLSTGNTPSLGSTFSTLDKVTGDSIAKVMPFSLCNRIV